MRVDEELNVLIIPDGNRRGAKKLGLSYRETYEIAAKKVDMVVKFFLKEDAVERIAVFGCSYDNVTKRGTDDMAPIYHAQEAQYQKWVEDPFFAQERIGIRFVGGLQELMASPLLPSGLPRSYVKVANHLEEITAENDWKFLYVLIGYSGTREVNQALLRALEFGDHNVDKSLVGDFMQFLDVPVEMDVVVRTGGEHRSSDCLPYQTSYSEYIFIDKFFPELESSDLETALNEFYGRDRRFGK